MTFDNLVNQINKLYSTRLFLGCIIIVLKLNVMQLELIGC